MDIAAIPSPGLKAWSKSRPRLEIDQSATWFPLLLIYAHGLTADAQAFKMPGMSPELTMQQLSLAGVKGVFDYGGSMWN